MKKMLCLLALLLPVLSCDSSDPKEEQRIIDPPDFIRAVDISFIPELRTDEVVFKNASGTEKDVLDIVKEAGCNTIRLRLWHTPENGHSSLEEVADFASEIQAKGLKLWLTVHYSDTWADPGTQTLPAAWSNATFAVLSDSVYNYTKKITTRLSPDFIQIGNEINAGLLWPHGRTTSNPSQFAQLLKRGAQAVRDVDEDIYVMMHYAGLSGADFFYGLLKSYNVDYDLLAFSYYPWWHGKDLQQLQSTLEDAHKRTGKYVLLAETAYPFTLGWNDWTNNIVGQEDHLVAGYPATPEGQKEFLLELRSILEETEGGVGFAYWAPEWVAYKGAEATNGSTWENVCLFDFENKALPALDAFADDL